MHTDNHGQIVYNESDIIDQLMSDPSTVLDDCLVDFEVSQRTFQELEIPHTFRVYAASDLSTAQFDKQQQGRYHMPHEYSTLDIAEYLLSKCTTQEQQVRVGQELLLYLERDAFSLLQYLKYLVDTMRKHNVVWGVGRGSSVASYVLYLLGVHRIDSIHYDLDITEFLR
jgi:DNA polymerase III alpha subunit